jgi:hypothetical protein
VADNGASDKHTRGECGLRYKLGVVGWWKTTAGQGGKSRRFVLFEESVIDGPWLACRGAIIARPLAGRRWLTPGCYGRNFAS